MTGSAKIAREAVSELSLEVVRVEGEPVSVRLSGHEFPCEDETGQTIVPRRFLTGFRLSEIPNDITIKPVESIEGHVIHVEHDIGLSQFGDGLALAVVEEMFRRKFWDAEVGLSQLSAAAGGVGRGILARRARILGASLI